MALINLETAHLSPEPEPVEAEVPAEPEVEVPAEPGTPESTPEAPEPPSEPVEVPEPVPEPEVATAPVEPVVEVELEAPRVFAWGELRRGDSLAVLRQMESDSIDAIVTDPPYGLSKEPDMAEVLTHWLAGDDYQHRGTGFMGKQWDSFVPGPSVWRECLRVLKPGGHLLCFAGSRTVDLMGISIRLAGFEVRDQMQWLYGCLTSDAEVLTERGWKLGVDVEVGDLIAQWNPESEAISLVPAERKYLARWDGPMRVIRNADTDQVLTPNHRVWHRTAKRSQVDGKRRYVYGDDWAVAEADQVTRYRPTTLPLSGFHGGDGIGGDDYASLLGWVWTEGGFDRTGTGVRIYQSPSANPVDVKEIDALIGRLGIDAKRYERERTYRYKETERPYTEVCWFFTGEWAQRVRADLPDKHPTWDLLWAMDLDEKYAFYEAAMRGDGSKSGTQFWQSHEGDLEWFQTLLHLIGKRGRVTMRQAPRTGGSVAFAHRGTTEMQHRHFAAASDEHYTGMVWCVGVPTGAFVARRNGKVFVTGNSGFPKSQNVAKMIDKMTDAPDSPEAREARYKGAKPAGDLRVGDVDPYNGKTIVGVKPGHENFVGRDNHAALRDGDTVGNVEGGFSRPWMEDPYAVMSAHFVHERDASSDAQRWDGWGTALKPAHEPIIMARKPLRVGRKKATVAKNVLAHGTGALNIDATRIGTSKNVPASISRHEARNDGVYEGNRDGSWGNEQGGAGSGHDPNTGRWPANVLLTHHEDCTEVGTRQVKTGTAVQRNGGGQAIFGGIAGGENTVGERADATYANPDGTETIPAFDCHEDCPVAILDGQSGERKAGGKVRGTEPSRTGQNGIYGDWGRVENKPHTDSGGASRFFYQAKVSKSERNAGLPEGMKNQHPTVKPVKLMAYLVRMVTPPGGTVLDPFCGSGSTGVAAVGEGFRFLGVDLDEDESCLEVAQHRIEHVAPSEG